MDHVRLATVNGPEKTKGRLLDVMCAIKKIIVVMKTAFLCLTHALIIAMVRVNGDPMYASYRDGYGLKKPIEELLKASGVDLSNGGYFEELEHFQEYLSDYKIVVFYGFNPDRVMFSGNSLSAKKSYLLYDVNSRHYNMITNIKAAMAKRYICNTCETLRGLFNKYRTFGRQKYNYLF